MAELATLMALRLQGVAMVARLGQALGVPEDEGSALAKALVREGMADERSGPVPGFALTGVGRDALDDALRVEGLRGDEALTDLYERFLGLNDRFLKLASDWQVRRHGPAEVPNDHSDPDYDQSVIDRLSEMHDRVVVLLGKIAERCPRLAVYRRRLDDCLHRLDRGERRAFTAPLAESYHTVWFELHQDLLLTLGLEREA